MKNALLITLILLAVASLPCRGQVGGNANYGQSGSKARAEQNERRKREFNAQELPPTRTGTFIEASVLMNVKAEEYVAVFALAQEAVTVEECGRKMDVTLADFLRRAKALGVQDVDAYVDFVAQNKVYSLEITGDIAKEKLTGFELKKNVSVRYRDPAFLNRLLVAASQAGVYDLVKVDYIVKDIPAVQERLIEEAVAIVRQKKFRYEKLLGATLPHPPQIYGERYAVYYPADLYDSYSAFESEQLTNSNRERYTVQSARKTQTFYYNGLDADGFDRVINPVVIEPMVQFTLYLKVRYDSDKHTQAQSEVPKIQ